MDDWGSDTSDMDRDAYSAHNPIGLSIFRQRFSGVFLEYLPENTPNSSTGLFVTVSGLLLSGGIIPRAFTSASRSNGATTEWVHLSMLRLKP